MNTYFKDKELNYTPVVKAIVQNPLGTRSVEVELVIDTGFQGGVLIPLNTYVELELNLFEEPKVVARTAIGRSIELRVSKVVVKFNGLSILCSAYTTIGIRRPLVGREVLRETGLLYKPPNELRILVS